MNPFSLWHPNQKEKELILLSLETQEICQKNGYNVDDTWISLTDVLHNRIDHVLVYAPTALQKLREDFPASKSSSSQCNLCIADCESFEAAARLHHPLVMNFANPRRPGGGFLFGALTQEESLCRTSTLYASLSSKEAEEMYEYNREHPSPFASDYMLLSPEVCVFRDSNSNLLKNPYLTAVITVPAPDKTTFTHPIPQEDLDSVVKNRLQNMFAVAALHGYRSLVLGAWGCGAFGNNTEDIARCFHDLLIEDNIASRFDHIVFAIPHDQEKLKIFQQTFHENA